ncbi:sigma-70 family RNA polymerase sigma factor [Limnofasciculus baicalensis]|nr:sigma-70 family RNA polymerase sigma factor [Limnofasciculus baicalensis]
MPQQPNPDELFRQLVCQTCRYPRKSLERRKGLNKLIQAIIKSDRLWRENTPYYEDALQQTWLYLCRNLCEADTAKEKYNPERSRVTTWLDRYLRRRLQDFEISEWERNKIEISLPIADSENQNDPIDNLPAPSDIPNMLDVIRDWAETDSDGELRNIHIKGRSELTCQLLILRRLPPETDWKSLSEEFNCSISTLANFYQRQCLPRLRRFGESQGYL